ncbi:MAG TPA: hypothetical protein VHD36_12030 [Pirellulales bacterium]|nr:hypothetical protein [Pirellulales bacterium]
MTPELARDMIESEGWRTSRTAIVDDDRAAVLIVMRRGKRTIRVCRQDENAAWQEALAKCGADAWTVAR